MLVGSAKIFERKKNEEIALKKKDCWMFFTEILAVQVFTFIISFVFAQDLHLWNPVE